MQVVASVLAVVSALVLPVHMAASVVFTRRGQSAPPFADVLKTVQVLLLFSLLSGAAASLDEYIEAGERLIKLQPGLHNFSGANISDSLTIIGASAGETMVQCAGAFAVTSALALHNLTIKGCQNGCEGRLGGIIRTDSGHVSLENVDVQQGSISCGGTGSVWLRGVNVTVNDSAAFVDGSCSLSLSNGHSDGELRISGTRPQVNVTDVLLPNIRVSSGEFSSVRILRVTGDLELSSNPTSGFARVMAADCTYPSGAPTVQSLGGASVHVGKGGASCDETCAEAGALCDGDTLAGIYSADKLRQLLAGTNVGCESFQAGSALSNPSISPELKTCTVGMNSDAAVPLCSVAGNYLSTLTPVIASASTSSSKSHVGSVGQVCRDSAARNCPANLLDGDLATVWHCNTDEGCWLEFDLGSIKYSIVGLVVTRLGGSKKNRDRFVGGTVQARKSREEEWSHVKTIPTISSSSLKVEVNLEATAAQYFRLYNIQTADVYWPALAEVSFTYIEQRSRICPCTAPTTLGPSIADCSQAQCGAGARCVDRKSREYEDVSTGRPANSSSYAVVGEVFDEDGRSKDGDPTCAAPFKKVEFEGTYCLQIVTGNRTFDEGYLSILQRNGHSEEFETLLDRSYYGIGSIVEKCMDEDVKVAVQSLDSDAWCGGITLNGIPMICENCDQGTITDSIGIDGDDNPCGVTKCPNGKICTLKPQNKPFHEADLKSCVKSCNEDIECAAAVHGVLDGAERCALSKDISLSSVSVNREDWSSIFTYQKANQWVLIADVQSTTVTNKAYWEGICASQGGNMEIGDTMKIVMGEVTDYFRPTESMTLCEFLTSPSSAKKFRWAASEAGLGVNHTFGRHDLFGGGPLSTRQKKPPLDKRQFISSWGGDRQGICRSADGEYGGYCSCEAGYSSLDACVEKLKDWSSLAAIEFKSNGCFGLYLSKEAPTDCPQGCSPATGGVAVDSYVPYPSDHFAGSICLVVSRTGLCRDSSGDFGGYCSCATTSSSLDACVKKLKDWSSLAAIEFKSNGCFGLYLSEEAPTDCPQGCSPATGGVAVDSYVPYPVDGTFWDGVQSTCLTQNSINGLSSWLVGGCCSSDYGNRSVEWSQPFQMYIKRGVTLEKGARTLEECQRLCRREPTCAGIQHDGSCELLVDPHCEFSESFKETGGQWTVQSRAAFDPELRRDAAKAVASLPPVITTANYFQNEGTVTNWWQQWWGVKLKRVSVDPHITISFREVGEFVGEFGRAINVYLTDAMPKGGNLWTEMPPGLEPCAQLQDLADWDTKEVMCMGRGTHLIITPATDKSRLLFARVLVKAPKILGTWCMESDTLFVSPEGSDDNKGEDPLRPLSTVQHAVNVAGDSGTTIRLGSGTFRGNELLPTGWKIPVTLADHIVEPVGLRGDYLSSVGHVIGEEGHGSAYFYFRVPEKGDYSVWIRIGDVCEDEHSETNYPSWFLRQTDGNLESKGIRPSLTNSWLKFNSTFNFGQPAVHVVELRGREPNCRISHVYFGKSNSNEGDGLREVFTATVFVEDPALMQIRLGCRSIVSPLLRRCNFNVETGSKQISIVGVSPQETAIDCGLSYDSECPHSSCLGHYNVNGLSKGAVARRAFYVATAQVLLKNMRVHHCMSARFKVSADYSPSEHFFKHFAHVGGCALFKETAVISAVNMQFQDCRARDGGAVFVSDHAAANFSNVSITGCAAAVGGAVKASGKQIHWIGGTVSTTVVTENKWLHGGGALFVTKGFGALRDVHFTAGHSVAAKHGAAIFSKHPINVTACTFTNNNGPEGVSDIFYASMTPSETKALLLQDNRFDRAGGVVVGLPRSCADNTANDGPTTIFPHFKDPLEVRCDLSSPGAPWTTFQRRVDATSFDLDWDAYKTGFSNAEKGKDGSFWLGNENIHELTKGGAKLRVDLCTLPEGDETSRELLESPNFERLEDWNVANEGAKSNGYVGTFARNGIKYSISSADEAQEECKSRGLSLCRYRGSVSRANACGDIGWTKEDWGFWDRADCGVSNTGHGIWVDDCVLTTKEGGNSPNQCCVFPFTYKGNEYSSCTRVNSNGSHTHNLWCSTTGMVYEGKWGNCVDNWQNADAHCCVDPPSVATLEVYEGLNFTSTGTHVNPGIAQRVKHIPNDINPSYGPVTYRFEVEGMSVTGAHYLLVRPVYIFGTDGPNDIPPKLKYLPADMIGNVSVEFTAPVWTGDEEKDVAYWYVGVFQSTVADLKKATMQLRRMSLKIVQDCASTESSDFTIAAAEDLYRLNVKGDFTSTTAKFGSLEESTYKQFNALDFPQCDANDPSWQVAAVIDGKKSTWNYDSALWTDASTFDDGNEKKTEAFNDAVSDQIRVKFEGLDDRAGCVHEFTYAHNLGLSLREIFAGGAREGLSPGRQTWIGMGCGDFATQENCNSHGFNAGKLFDLDQDLYGMSRYGIVFNNQDNCDSPDAVIGIGMSLSDPAYSTNYGHDTNEITLSAGGLYGCCTSGGIHKTQPVRATISVVTPCFAANTLSQFPKFRFPFMEMKLQPHSIQLFPSTVADCSQSTCADRCIDRSNNMGVWCLPASPKTIWVSPTGSDELNDGISAPLATIQRGIHYASEGDTVELMPGTYTGGADCETIGHSSVMSDEFNGATFRRCNYNIDFMGKHVTVDGHGHATVDCEADGWSTGQQPARRGFYFGRGTTSILKGVTISRCKTSATGSWSISRVHRGQQGGGIAVWGSSPTLVDIVIRDCGAANQGGCIYVHSAENVLLKNVSCINSHASGGSSLYIESSGLSWYGGIIRDNTVAGTGLILIKHSDVMMSELQMKGNTFRNTKTHHSAITGQGSGSMVVIGAKVMSSSVANKLNFSDLSILPDFTGTVRAIDTNFSSSVFDPNGRIQTCNASDACTVGNHTGTCANADVGVSCYGCGLDNNQYECHTGLSVKIVNPPSAFVAAGIQTRAVTVSDPRCDQWQLQIDTGQWQSSSNPVIVPELAVGRQKVAIRAVCPGFPPVFSKPANASWTVVDGRPTNTSISGPVLTNDPSPVFTLGANKEDCSYEYRLDDGPPLKREAATTDSLSVQWLNELPPVWPHPRAAFFFASSAGIGTRFSVSLDNQTLETVVARGSAQARVELSNLTSGAHTLSVTAEAAGKFQTITSAFSVVNKIGEQIDTLLRGGPVGDHAFFLLDSTGAEWGNYEYMLDPKIGWRFHDARTLQLGPLNAGDHELQVRAVDKNGGKDPVPARFMWTVGETPPSSTITMELPPVDTKATHAAVRVSGASTEEWSYSVDHGPKRSGPPPGVIGPLLPGKHTLRVWTGSDPAPILSSWVQSPMPAFGRAKVDVAATAPGEHVLFAKATDPLGLEDATGAAHHFFADFEPPLAQLDLPSVQRNNVTRVSVNCTDNHACSDLLTVSIDGGAQEETTRSGFVTKALAEGTHEIRLWAHDEAGNKQTDFTSVTIEIDRTPPPRPKMALSAQRGQLTVSVEAQAAGTWRLQHEKRLDATATVLCGEPEYVDTDDVPGTVTSGTITLDALAATFELKQLAPRNYRILVTLRDEVGNTGTYASSSIKVDVNDPPPTRPVVSRVGSRRLNVSWGAPPQRDAATLLGYDIHWSPRSEFDVDVLTAVIDPSTNQSLSWIVETASPVEAVKVFVRVRVTGTDVWSQLSLSWTTAQDCGAASYLDDRWPRLQDAEGAPVPVESWLDPVTTRWRCEPCPEGASCEGDVTWGGVQALFGWWRVRAVPVEEGQSAAATEKKRQNVTSAVVDLPRSNFTRCIYPPACHGAANPMLAKRYMFNGTDPALAGLSEGCAVDLGHRQACTDNEDGISNKGKRCRLCHTCLPNFERGSRGQCMECFESSHNRWLLAAGAFFVLLGASALVWMQIDNQGKGGLSDAVKKVLLNYLQMAALSQGFPLQWPAAVESLFAAQSTVSTAGQYLLRPDCELSMFNAADAFYRKMIMFAAMPLAVSVCSAAFWAMYAKCRHERCGIAFAWPTFLPCCSYCRAWCACSNRLVCRRGPVSWRERSETGYSPKDKMVLTLVVLLYMLYPTTLLQTFSMLACKKVGEHRYLVADLQEPCFEGRHLTWVLALCVPQLILYVVSLPVLSVFFLNRNKARLWSSRVVMFRYGLLFNGYSKRAFFWEATMATRKASIVALGVFGSLTGVESQVHVGLALLVAFLVMHLVAAPYDKEIDPRGILHTLDSTSLIIVWSTLWSGVLFLRGNLLERVSKELLTVAIVGVNVLFTLRGVYLLVRELLREKGLVDKLDEALVRVRSTSRNSQVRLDVGDPQKAPARHGARKTDESKSRNNTKDTQEKEEEEEIMKKKKKREKIATTKSGARSIEMATMAPQGSEPVSSDEIFKDRLRAASKQLSTVVCNPLVSVQNEFRGGNPAYGIAGKGELGDDPVAAAMLSESAANKKDDEEYVDSKALRYCYGYAPDGEIYFYREDGVGGSVWDLPEGAVRVE